MEKFIAYSVFVPVIIIVGSTLIPRQYWLRVNQDSIPDAIKSLHVIKMPFWFLNLKGKVLFFSFWGTAILWIAMLVGTAIHEAL